MNILYEYLKQFFLVHMPQNNCCRQRVNIQQPQLQAVEYYIFAPN